jgi:uroporphyrinogen-III synthase
VGFAVITRDPVDAEAYATALAPLGLIGVAMPVTRTHPPTDRGALARAFADGRYDAIVVASPRAAHALAAAAGDARQLPEVWAVGAATARALAIEDIAAIVPDGVVDGAGLARALAPKVAGKRVLVPRAEDGRDEPVEILRAAGADVVAVAAYKTVAMTADDPRVARGRALLVAGDAAAACVFAPSQVDALADIVGALAAIATTFCAIGETTARALREAGCARVAVAAEPSPAGMARAVASVYPSRAP